MCYQSHNYDSTQPTEDLIKIFPLHKNAPPPTNFPSIEK